MEHEDMIKVKFIRQKGQCYPGYEAEFEAIKAKKLITDGFAEAVKPTPKTKTKAKVEVKSEETSKQDK